MKLLMLGCLDILSKGRKLPFKNKQNLTNLLWQQEVCEDLHASVGVNVSVELHQGLVLVVGQPDGGDALHFDEGDWQMRDVVTRQVQDCQLGEMSHLVR